MNLKVWTKSLNLSNQNGGSRRRYWIDRPSSWTGRTLVQILSFPHRLPWKWGTVTRSDLDSDLIQKFSKYLTVSNEKPMLFISSSRRLVYFVNALAILAWVIGFLCVTYLFEFGIASIFGLLVHAGICVLISRFPRQSRLTLSSWKRTKRDKALQELLKQI